MAKQAAKRAAASTIDPPFKMADWPAENIERRKVTDLKPHPKNPKKHPKAQLEALAASYREFGVTVPILIDEKNTTIAGEGRWSAAKLAGIEDVPVAVARGWSERKKLKYMFADNQLPLLGEFDESMRAELLKGLEVRPEELAALGVSSSQLAELIAAGTPQPLSADEPVTPPRKTPIRRGDVFTLGEHRLMCGDSTSKDDVSALLAGNVPNLMVTDPPYGVSYDPSWRARSGVNLNEGKLGKVMNDSVSDWRAAWELFPGNVVYVWHADWHATSVDISLRACKFDICAKIVWAKDRFALSRGDYHWQHEPCWYGVRKGKKHNWTGDRSQSTLWQIPSRDDDGHGHGTQKPVECMKRPIENNSRRGDFVYEPFSGSGTTIIACEITGRRALAMELDPVYVHTAIERWEAMSGAKAKLSTGETLDDLKRGRKKDAARNSRKSVRGKRAVAAVSDPAGS